MICPYCNEEMEKGVIQSPQEISWSKKRRLVAGSVINDDTVVLSEFSFLKGSIVDAFLCRKCKYVIIKYE